MSVVKSQRRMGDTAVKRSARMGRMPRAKHLAPMALCVPFFCFFALFIVVPVGYAIALSLEGQHRTGLGLTPPTEVFIGFHNYITAFTDSSLRTGLLHVLEFFVVETPIMVILAMVIALLLDRQESKIGQAIVRTICFLPFSMPLVVGSVMWSFLYDPELSPFVHAAGSLGLANLNPLDPQLIFWSISNILVWEWTGYNVIIFVTALQGMPTEVLEAARIDGASEWKTALFIKLPMLRPALVMVSLFTMIGVLQMFGEPKVLSAIASALSSNYTPIMYVYSLAFVDNLLNYAAAVAVILAVLTGLASFVTLRLTRRISDL
jgi:multiple sugar transport system permease protein